MSRLWVWMLPVLLAAAQVLTWPGVPLLRGDRVPAAAGAAAVTITVAAAVALLWRRSNPVASAVAVAAVLASGAWGLPEDALLVIVAGDLIALFSVAARRPLRVALAVTAGLVAVQVVITLTDGSDELSAGAEIALVTAFYAVVLAAGRRRARWRSERHAAAERFAIAEAGRARAADTERLRLARELHDVTAHHLTSIVVGASAAQRLAGKRPELARDALEHAARTGRDTLEALRRLVAIMQAPPVLSLPELVASFREAGQPVTLTEPGTPLPASVPAIVREALTNTLRYAPGAATRVTVAPAPAGLELTVDNDAPLAGGAGGDLGGGNGIAGMRERARAEGGDLDAGPLPGGGWRVRATLPGAAAGQSAARPARAWSAHAIDAAMVVVALLVPGTAMITEPGLRATPGSAALMAAIVAIHALPLALRRSRPWTTLAAVSVTGAAWPAGMLAGLLPAGSASLTLTLLVADLIAVHAVARYGRRPGADWLAWPAGVLAQACAVGAAAAAEPPDDLAGVGDLPPWPVTAALIAVITGLTLAVPVGGAWLAGWLVRRRRSRVTGNEREWLAWSAHHTAAAAAAERARIADGLGDAVLRRTGDMIAAAERGDLDDVLVAARDALGAMRGLLQDLRGPVPRTAPQPTLAALPGLVERWRSHGRAVTLRLDDAGRELPDDVGVSAYRMVELLLTAETGPAELEVDAAGDPVRIVIRPAPADPDGEIAAGLRARSGRIHAVPGGMRVELG